MTVNPNFAAAAKTPILLRSRNKSMIQLRSNDSSKSRILLRSSASLKLRSNRSEALAKEDTSRAIANAKKNKCLSTKKFNA